MSDDSSKPRRRLALHWQILIGLVVGGVSGALANAFLSPKPHGFPSATVTNGWVTSVDPAANKLGISPRKGDTAAQQTVAADELRLLDARGDETALDRFRANARIKIIRQSGSVVAVRWESGLEWFAQNVAEPIGQIFLRLIFMVVVPLVFSALVLGVAGIGDVRKLGRMGVRTLVFTLVLSSASVAIGLVLANTIRPGARLSEAKRAELRERFASQEVSAVQQARQAKSVRDSLLDIIPKNPLQEMVGALDGSSPGGGMLAVMFFALCVGIAITMAPSRTAPLVAWLEGLFDVSMIIIGWAMRLAPIGVAGLIFSLTAVLGFDILQTLAWYVATVIGGLALHMFGVYSLLTSVFARMSPRRFFGRITEVMLTAFATSSSNATLPTSLRVTEQNLGVRREVASFVLTVGSTANQNGTALYEGITVLFLAQVFGKDLQLSEQIMVVLFSVLAGIGTAGVPGGSLPLVAILLLRVGVPAEGLGIILGVDRLLDMCRTTLNVTGDIAVATCVNASEDQAAPAGAGSG
jgi:DAACS family dicarboxylate/amino acid:cation (Na+ or H+) symporter